MWSFNREGECDPVLAADRNAVFGIDTGAKAERRSDLVALAHPQYGVDDMAGQFAGGRPVEGVTDVRADGTDP